MSNCVFTTEIRVEYRHTFDNYHEYLTCTKAPTTSIWTETTMHLLHCWGPNTHSWLLAIIHLLSVYNQLPNISLAGNIRDRIVY